MSKKIMLALAATSALSACSLAPDFVMPKTDVPAAYKEEADAKEKKGEWKEAASLEKTDRGQWWRIFGDEKLNELEKQAADANQSLKAAASRVVEARANARANAPSYLPDLDLGGNAVRTQPASATLAAFGGTPGTKLKPYTLYNAQGVASYEVDLFSRVRDNYKALERDADAQQAAYQTTLLALQADVAQNYFALRELDAERKLVRETVGVRTESARILTSRFNHGDVSAQDKSRGDADLASVQADLLVLERQRAVFEHAMAVLLGKMPSEYSFAEAPLDIVPPSIPAGLPSTLLERRPDVASAQASMMAANLRIGVARTAFFPSINLTASGGFESVGLGELFQWSNRTWALGQLAGAALSIPVFHNGRDLAGLDFAHAQYDESVATYRQQVLVAFRDVEDNLSGQKLLALQSEQSDIAAHASTRTMELTRRRYDEGDVDYFQVVNDQRDSLAAERAALQTRGQRFQTTVALIRALGGGWDEVKLADAAPVAAPVSPDAAKEAAKPDAPEKAAVKPETPEVPPAKPLVAEPEQTKPEAAKEAVTLETPEVAPAKLPMLPQDQVKPDWAQKP